MTTHRFKIDQPNVVQSVHHSQGPCTYHMQDNTHNVACLQSVLCRFSCLFSDYA